MPTNWFWPGGQMSAGGEEPQSRCDLAKIGVGSARLDRRARSPRSAGFRRPAPRALGHTLEGIAGTTQVSQIAAIWLVLGAVATLLTGCGSTAASASSTSSE